MTFALATAHRHADAGEPTCAWLVDAGCWDDRRRDVDRRLQGLHPGHRQVHLAHQVDRRDVGQSHQDELALQHLLDDRQSHLDERVHQRDPRDD